MARAKTPQDKSAQCTAGSNQAVRNPVPAAVESHQCGPGRDQRPDHRRALREPEVEDRSRLFPLQTHLRAGGAVGPDQRTIPTRTVCNRARGGHRLRLSRPHGLLQPSPSTLVFSTAPCIKTSRPRREDPLSFMVRHREPWDREAGPVLVVLLHLHRGDLFVQDQHGDSGPAIEMNPSGDRRNPGFVAQEQ